MDEGRVMLRPDVPNVGALREVLAAGYPVFVYRRGGSADQPAMGEAEFEAQGPARAPIPTWAVRVRCVDRRVVEVL